MDTLVLNFYVKGNVDWAKPDNTFIANNPKHVKNDIARNLYLSGYLQCLIDTHSLPDGIWRVEQRKGELQ